MAGVNSFGFGGANVARHSDGSAAALAVHDYRTADTDRAWPLLLSARSEEALAGRRPRRLSAWLERSFEVEWQFASVAGPHLHARSTAQSPLASAHRDRALGGRDDAGTQRFLNGTTGSKLRTAFTPRREQATRVVFVMSGQGPQWWGMGRELMRHEPVFRRMIEACDKAMRPWARFSLMEELARPEEGSHMHRTEISQPAIFAMQMALAELWKSWGVQPAAVVGHSVGEVAAACVAGILSLEQAAQVIVHRGRFMDECAPSGGTMLAVGMSADEARAVIARHDRTVSIAAFNGPAH